MTKSMQQPQALTAHYLCLIHAFQKTECTVLNACPTRWPSYRSPATESEKWVF